MTTISQEDFARLRQTVIDVLEGRISRKLTPQSYCDDDFPHLAVAYLEQEDPEWLLERLQDARYPFEGRLEAALGLTKHADWARKLLGFEGTAVEFSRYGIEILGMPGD